MSKHSLLPYLGLENIYRPQRSCEGYVFTPVCHSVHRVGVCLSACWDTTPPQSRHPLGADTPQIRHPPGADTPWNTHPPRPGTLPGAGNPPPREQRRLLLRTVRILLECILVGYFFNLRIRQSVLFWSLTFQKDC